MARSQLSNDADRADPDVTANVAAGETMAAHIGIVATAGNGDLVGYWLHPDEPAGRPPAVIKYDTEGTYGLLPGAGLAEALIGDHVFDDDGAFAELADEFGALGITVTARRWDDLPHPETTVDPEQLHISLYRANGGHVPD